MRILALAQEVFGGVQSEASLDFCAPHLDRFMYCETDATSNRPYVDKIVPPKGFAVVADAQA